MFPIHDDTERIHGRPFINYTLIAINVMVFIYEIFVTGFFSNRRETFELFAGYGAIPELIFQGNYFSILTSMFMHGGISHILGNMVFLYVFGDNIEDRLGHLKYLGIYILWGVAAALIHSLFAIATQGGNIPAVGASGAISGVLGAYLILFPRAKIFTIIFAFFITTIRIPALAYIPFWFILQVILGFFDPFGGVAYMAHIGGFVVGAGTAFIWKLFKNTETYENFKSKQTNANRIRQIPLQYESKPVPEIIEKDNLYEIIVELRGIVDVSEVKLNPSTTGEVLRIYTTGIKKYDFEINLPEGTRYTNVKNLTLLNNILRIQIEK